MAGRALNDDEVANEMKKMTQFIKQEANEKAREIQVKSDEEHNIEKAKLVRQETIAIDALFQKKMKQAEVQRKIAQSNHINKARLKVLQSREESLNDLHATAKAQLKSISSGPQYAELLAGLLLQGMHHLLEKEVTVVCRQVDVQLVEAALGKARQEYLKTVPAAYASIHVSVDKSRFLPATSAGGVLLTALEGRIECDNTLDARLELAFEKMLPAIRLQLFGASAQRRFFD